MDENISKLANSVNVAERKQALRAFLALADWPSNKELACLFLDDPDRTIFLEISEAILTKCPQKFLPELKLIALGEDKELRAKVLSFLADLDTFKGIELFLERMPLEEPVLSAKLRAAVKRLIEKDYKTFLRPLLSCAGSDNDAVRKESLSIFVSTGEPANSIREFYLFLQAISPSVREKLLITAKEHREWFIKFSVDLLKTEQNPNIRLQITNVLEDFSYPGLEDVLLEELKQKDWALKHNVIKTLAVMKSEKAKPLLVEAMDDKELALQAILALDSYRQADIGIIFLRKLGKSGDQEQIALLNGIKNLAAGDKRYIEPLLVFAAHEVSKEKAKSLAIEVVLEICKKTNTPTPEKIAEIESEIKRLRLGHIPDLGLKFSQD